MTRFMTLALVVLCAQATFGQEALQPRITFPVNGFSLTPLEEPAGDGAYQSIIMFMAPSEGFAPNLNVQIQTFDGTMQDYADLSTKEFQQLNFQVLKEQIGEAAAIWEYTGATQDKSLHWYTAAHKRDGKIYLVTATALESQWQRIGDKLRKSVESFRLEQPTTLGAPAN